MRWRAATAAVLLLVGAGAYRPPSGVVAEAPAGSRRALLRAAGAAATTLGLGRASCAPRPARAAAASLALSPEGSKLERRATTAAGKGEPELAAQLWRRLTRLEPDYPYGWVNCANAEVAVKRLQDALADYDTGLGLLRELGDNGDLWVVLLNRGATTRARARRRGRG